MAKFKLSVGELIDRISIINIKIWHAEEALSAAHVKKEIAKVAELAVLTRTLNKERSILREEINMSLKGVNQGSRKLNYAEIGRDK